MAPLGTFDTTQQPDILRQFQCTAWAKGGAGVGSQGNNKFYIIKAWKRGDGYYNFRAEYGKVGQEGNPAVDEKAGVTLAWIEGKAHEKLYKKSPPYVEIDLHATTAPVALTLTDGSAPVTTTHPKVSALVDWMFREAGEAISKFLRGRVEKLSQSQIQRGRAALREIRDAHARWKANPNKANEEVLEQLVLGYFNLVPTVLPRNLDKSQVIQDFCNELGDHEDRLNQLEAAIATTAATNAGQTQYVALGAEIDLLPQTDNRYAKLVEYVQTRANHGYICKVKDIYMVRVPAATAKWDACQRGKDNVKLLVHGSRNQNWRHILKTGLRMPQFHNNGVANGTMFGAGIYFADQPTKSGNYCGSGWQNVSGSTQYALLLTDVALGKSYTPRGSDSSLSLSKLQSLGGYDSVFAKGSTGQSYGVRGESGVLNNEFIIFDEGQHKPRFLVTWEKSY